MTRVQERPLLIVPPDARFDAAWLGTPTRGPGLTKTAVSPAPGHRVARVRRPLARADQRRLDALLEQAERLFDTES